MKSHAQVLTEKDSRRFTSQERRAATSGFLGVSLEYFDFAIYGALSAALIPKLFFDDLGSTGALLASFATFGVGFVARPAGAIVFGHLGDKFGRRPVLMATLILMGVCTAAIGLLPTGQGIVVAAVLVLLRFFQGFSLGGEATGNQLMAIEHSHSSRRGFIGSIVVAGSAFSQVFALGTLAILTAVLSTEQWETWGWRIPFIGGLLIVLVAIYIRRALEETPAFIAAREETHARTRIEESGIQALRKQPLRVARLVMAWGGLNFSYYVVAVYGIAHLTNTVGLDSSATFLILMVANAASCGAAVAGGYMSDRHGRKGPVLVAYVFIAVGVVLFFALSDKVGVVLIALIACVPLCAVQFTAGIQPALFAEQFPTRSRFAGSASAFTISVLLFGSLAPFVAAALTEIGGTSIVIVISVVLSIVLIGFIATLPRTSQADLTEFDRDGQDADVPLLGEVDMTVADPVGGEAGRNPAIT